MRVTASSARCLRTHRDFNDREEPPWMLIYWRHAQQVSHYASLDECHFKLRWYSAPHFHRLSACSFALLIEAPRFISSDSSRVALTRKRRRQSIPRSYRFRLRCLSHIILTRDIKIRHAMPLCILELYYSAPLRQFDFTSKWQLC
jgi:hypothetical protein